MAEQRQARRGGAGRILLAAAAVALIGAGIGLSRRPPAAVAPAPAVRTPTRGPAAASEAANPASAASASAVASAPPAPTVPAWIQQRASEATAAAMDKLRSPAEALRKVQLGLNGGTPEEVLEAARTLQMCSVMSGAPEAMYAMRDRPGDMPELVKKTTDSNGGINHLIQFAESEARRCQVFDTATMGRRMELFQRAYQGGAEGAAVDYLMALQNPAEKQKTDAALITKLQADIRDAAAIGDTGALQYLGGVSGDRARELGVTPAQRAGYQAAWKLIVDERFPGMSEILGKATASFSQPASAPALSPAEQAEAQALAQQVVMNWRSKRKGG